MLDYKRMAGVGWVIVLCTTAVLMEGSNLPVASIDIDAVLYDISRYAIRQKINYSFEVMET